jgi:hypothetical protein
MATEVTVPVYERVVRRETPYAPQEMVVCMFVSRERASPSGLGQDDVRKAH